MKEQHSSLSFRMFVALLFALGLHFIIMIMGSSSATILVKKDLAIKIIKIPQTNKKKVLSSKKKQPRKKSQPPKKKKKQPRKKVLPPKKKKIKKKILQKKIPKIRTAIYKKKKPKIAPPKILPPKKKKTKKIVKKTSPKKKKKTPKKIVKKRKKPSKTKVKKKVSLPKKQPVPKPFIQNIKQYNRYLKQELASTNIKGMYIPPIGAPTFPPKAVSFFQAHLIVLDKREINQREKALTVKVDDLQTGKFKKVTKPQYIENFYSGLSFVLEDYPTEKLFDQISRKFKVPSNELILIAFFSKTIGQIFTWKVLKTIQKSGLHPKQIASIEGVFQKIGNIWIFKINFLFLKNGTSIPVEDFESKIIAK